jgi:hypothetical protein
MRAAVGFTPLEESWFAEGDDVLRSEQDWRTLLTLVEAFPAPVVTAAGSVVSPLPTPDAEEDDWEDLIRQAKARAATAEPAAAPRPPSPSPASLLQVRLAALHANRVKKGA